jgi:hypothetical protein
MRTKIQPVKIKIFDTVEANTLDVVVNQDNGTSCVVSYNFSCVTPASAPSTTVTTSTFGVGMSMSGGGSTTTALGGDRFTLAGSEYTAFSTSPNRFQYAINYVATKFGLTLLP